MEDMPAPLRRVRFSKVGGVGKEWNAIWMVSGQSGGSSAGAETTPRSAQAVRRERGIQRRAAGSCRPIRQHVAREMAEHEIIWLSYNCQLPVVSCRLAQLDSDN